MTHSPTKQIGVEPPSVSAQEMAGLIEEVLAEHHPTIDRRSLRLSTNLKRAYTLLSHREEVGVHHRFGCPPAAFRVLAMLWIFGRMDTRDICKLAGVTRQAVAGVLATLEKRELIGRDRAVGADKRRITVWITPRGVDVIRPGLSAQNVTHTEFFGALDEREAAELSHLLGKLVGSES